MGAGAGARALLREFVRAGQGFGDYNLRECDHLCAPHPPLRYVRRRAVEGFREGLEARGAEAEALLEGGRRELEAVRRQAAVQSLYSAPHKSYMDLEEKN